MEAAIIVTYRCQSKCRMCRTWMHPTRPEEEFAPALLTKLPLLSFCNITGGEPFLREDIGEIVRIAGRKARRVVISTNGQLTDRVLDLARSDRRVGFRVSLEGLAPTNDALRGIAGGYDRGLGTLLELKRLGIKDIGMAITVSDENAKDLLELYRLSRELGVEFATAAVHNSFYFHTRDNAFRRPEEAAARFEDLSRALLRERRPKSWFRAYFNSGLAGYVRGRVRPLPCGAATDFFFLDPWGRILPCNGMEESTWFESLGDLTERSFKEIWSSDRARRVRARVAACSRDCWMIGSAGPAMRRHILRPSLWVLKRKMGPGRPRR
jgi:radical SAM protein with 4Fe4S-binding SPASM domain